jgi:hypothetical protein
MEGASCEEARNMFAVVECETSKVVMVGKTTWTIFGVLRGRAQSVVCVTWWVMFGRADRSCVVDVVVATGRGVMCSRSGPRELAFWG